MNQRQRSGENRAADLVDSSEEGTTSSRTPLESGIAPRDRAQAEQQADEAEAEGEEGDSLYDRLLRSGAFDEVLEVAAREQEEQRGEGGPSAAGGSAEQARGPVSDVVPSRTTEELDEIDVEIVDPPSARFDIGPDDDTPVRLPLNDRAPALPSVMLEPSTAPRRDTTDRVVLKEERARQRPSLTPAARPATSRRPRSDGRPMLAVVALLFLTAGALVFWLATRPPKPEAVAPRQPAPGSMQIESSLIVQLPVQEVSPAEPAPAELEEATPPPASKAPRAARRGQRAARRSSAPAAPAESSQAADPESELPEQPSKAQVVQAMQAMLPALEECAAGDHGDTRLHLTVRGTGKVSHVEVRGSFEGTPAGSCMARAVRGASFPEFGSPVVRMTYPVRL